MQYTKARDVCRLCAKAVITSEFEVRRVGLRKIMDVLNIKLKENALMCFSCSEKLDKIYNFKISFLKSENYITMVKNNAVLDRVNEISSNGALEEDLHNQDIRICRLCKTSNMDNVSYRDFLENNNMQYIYGIHFPEIKFDYSKHWVICRNCINELKDFGDIKLKLNNDKPPVHNFNQGGTEKQLFVRLVNLNLLTNMTTVDSRISRHLHKIVSSNATKTTDKRFQKVNTDNFSTTSKSKKSHMLSLDSYIMNEQNEDSNYQSKKTLPLVFSGLQYFCQDCKVVGCNHEIAKKCMTEEPGMFYCAQCDYKSKTKYSVKLHMIVHKTPFETKMFQCKECNYKTKHLNGLRMHQITHKSREETVMYKCDYCSFESKHKYSAKQHIKVHQSKDECETYDCRYCDFRGKTPGNLRTHLISHQTPEVVRWYGCDKCHFKTRYKANFSRHLIVHQSVDEAKMIKCQFCDYESKHQGSVKKHLLRHDTDDVKIFKCSECTYETKHRNNYERHLLTHKKYGEVPMIKCPDCDYQTNYKYSMKYHQETQHDPQAKRYSCPDCSYKTTIKGNMTKHSVIHKSDKKAVLYHCDYCEFKSKHRGSFKQHLTIHRPEIAKMFECPYCDHKTKVRHSLKCHVRSIHGKNLNKDVKLRTHLRKFQTPNNS